jgi:hypothetical protein
MISFRATLHDPDDEDDDDDSTDNVGGHVDVVHDAHDLDAAAHFIHDMNDFDMTGEVSHSSDPPTHVTTILAAVDAQLRQRTPEALARTHNPHLAYVFIDDLLRDPFFTTVQRDPRILCCPFPH